MLKRAFHEQQLRQTRLELKEVALQIAKERKKAKEQEKVKAAMGGARSSTALSSVRGPVKTVQKVRGLYIDKVHKWMAGTSKAGITYGPGHVCWQCEHRANGKKGGHAHSCGKTLYAR